MTCRSLLWIAAAASIAAATCQPSVAVAEPGPGWTITIDAPAEAVVESKHLTIEGTASNEAGVDEVTVTAVPQGLPPQCGPETGRATMDGGGYVIGLDVSCNGPHEIQVRADGAGGDSASGEPRIVGVAERPPTPLPPDLTVTDEGGLRASWDPGQDIDSAGTILLVDFREETIDRGIGEAILPPADRLAAVSMRALRWGAAGPGTTVSSPESGGAYIGPDPPPEPPDESTDPTQPPPSLPLTPPPPGSNGPRAITTPSGSQGGGNAPPSASVPSTAAPDDHWEAQGPGSGAVGVWPEPERRPSSDIDERAASAAPTEGLVRTSDERPAGFVALLGFALLIASIAATFVWLNRHAHPRP